MFQRTLSWKCRDKPRNGRNICKSQYDKGLMSIIYKELLQFNNKKATHFKNGQRIWIDVFSKKGCKEGLQEKILSILIKCKSKAQWEITPQPLGQPWWKGEQQLVLQRAGDVGTWYSAGGRARRCGHFRKQSGSYSKLSWVTTWPRNSTPRYIPPKLKTHVYTKACVHGSS